MVFITEVKKSFWKDCLQSFVIGQNGDGDGHTKVSCVVDIFEGKDIEKEVEKILSTEKVELPFRLNVCKKVWGPESKMKIFLIMFFISWVSSLCMIFNDQTVSKLLFITFCCLNCLLVFMIREFWNWYFFIKPDSYLRSNSKCISNRLLPELQINGNLENRFNDAENDYVIVEKPDENIDGVKYGVYKKRPFPIDERGRYLNRMAHQYMSFWENLYVSMLLYPGVIFQIFFGNKYQGGLAQFLFIRLKGFLKGSDGENCKNNEEELILFELILETTLSIMIEDLRTSDTNDLEGDLVIPGCTNFTKDKEILVGTLSVGLNISKRKILFCSFDESNISVTEALSISTVAFFGLVHSVTHCESNWGICSEILSSSFLRLMSLLTIKYNHMGYHFGSFLGMLKTLGVTRYVGYKEGCAAIHHGVHTLKPCPDLKLLKNPSKFVNFFWTIKEFFIQEFNRYKEDFPGINCEAMFQGTIMHSIDHTNAAYLLKADYFSSSSPNSEMARLILCCFVEKPPSLIETRFSKAPHPLYRNVYTFASKIDKRLADAMDCCIDM